VSHFILYPCINGIPTLRIVEQPKLGDVLIGFMQINVVLEVGEGVHLLVSSALLHLILDYFSAG